jgi:hypothetical protein
LSTQKFQALFFTFGISDRFAHGFKIVPIALDEVKKKHGLVFWRDGFPMLDAGLLGRPQPRSPMVDKSMNIKGKKNAHASAAFPAAFPASRLAVPPDVASTTVWAVRAMFADLARLFIKSDSRTDLSAQRVGVW